jgi:hypothetical protein
VLRIYIRDAPDTDLAGNPTGRISANLKAGYIISSETGYPAGFSAENLNVLKHEINKEMRCNESSFDLILTKAFSFLF